MKPNVYGLTFFRQDVIIDGYLYPASFLQSECTTIHEAVEDWAEIMVVDANRPEGVPLYEYVIQVNGITVMSSLVTTSSNNDDGSLDHWPYKDEVNRLLLLSSVEMDRLLEKQRNEAYMAGQALAVDLGILRPTNGPGRRT